jgi:hypothetical protein
MDRARVRQVPQDSLPSFTPLPVTPTSHPGESQVQRAPFDADLEQDLPSVTEEMPLVEPAAPAPAQESQPEVSVPDISPMDDGSFVQGELIQRAASDYRSDWDPAEAIDLPELAKRLLPIVRRMLSIERERRPLR